jgi:transposase
MRVIRLAARAYRTLQTIIHSSPKARLVRRAQALGWLHENETVQTVARRLRLSRPTIYDIVPRYQTRTPWPLTERIRDRPHPGRPATQRQRTEQILQALLKQPPARFGYRSPIWTVPMLRHPVENRLRRPLSRDTVRRALHALRQCYKRPRLVLARRAPYWRQAKGGSKTA